MTAAPTSHQGEGAGGLGRTFEYGIPDGKKIQFLRVQWSRADKNGMASDDKPAGTLPRTRGTWALA